ncbi:MAG: outer membrane protein transport protein [Tannerellaceae bacterium]|nr:outer membrane protein transport protein [Tannerellaceae bacterium]
MKKIAGLIIAGCIMGVGSLQAQGQMDAYKLSQTDINGTARYLSMGGAFGALGGDVSVMSTNPAGLGIYRSSEVVGTVSLNIFNTNTNWLSSQADMTKTRFNLDNFAYVGYFPTGNDDGLVSWNVGFSYNKLKNFNRRYKMSGNPSTSLSDYIGAYTELLEPYASPGDFNVKDPYANNVGLPWMSVLGVRTGMIGFVEDYGWDSFMGFTNNEDKWVPFGIDKANLEVQEHGGIDQYNFSFATNISNVFFIGATLGVTDLNYRVRTYYDEDFGAGNYLEWDNALSTDGSGVNVNVGIIVRPTDFLRLGVAYNSPTWYKLTDSFHATAKARNITEYPNDPAYSDETPVGVADYKFRTPDRWIFSAAAILGTNGLISVDYELSNFQNSRFHDVDGRDYLVNDDIRNYFRSVNTLKIGAEYKITPQFALRAGGYWQSSSAKSYLQDNELKEILPAGTLVNYSVDKGAYSASVGFGYRFTPNFYMDMAYVYRQQKENAYAFSSVFFDDPQYDVLSQSASLKTNTSRIALTFGYKF